MKKTLIKCLLPLMAGLAVIGSGFSLWVFEYSHIEKDQTPGKEVTQYVGLGEITVADDFKVVFDQTLAKRQAIPVTGADAIPANGITLEFTGGTNKKAVYTSSADADELDQTADGKIYHEFSTTISLGADLWKEVEVAWTDATATVTSVGTAGAETGYKITLGKNVDEFDWTKTVWTYKNEPTNKTEYNTFKTVVNAATIKVTYAVDIKVA